MTSQQTLQQFGFKFGQSGAHASRTMMLDELELLFAGLPVTASLDDYRTAIEQDNILQKNTSRTRTLTCGHLIDLYSLDPQIPLFRNLRRLWDCEPAARPLLTCQMALTRDPLLRLSQHKILELSPGTVLPRIDMEHVFADRYPDRFSSSTLKSLAQNLNATWTHAGFLQGRAKKTRTEPDIHPVNVAFALWLGHLQGASGTRLFTTDWTKLLNCRLEQLQELARQASFSGLLTYKHSSEIIEITFPDYLTKDEEALLYE